MKILTLSILFILSGFFYTSAQKNGEDKSWNETYRGSYQKVNDLVHVKLEAKFDYNKSYLLGKVWITLKPHFYTTDSVQLDAKGMDIHSVSLVRGSNKSTLKYKYDGWLLTIMLDKVYTRSESYMLYIEYTAKPNEMKVKGSTAITDAKGLYFINSKGEQKGKPIQIWTQGETEGTSVWCPLIDKPNQKATSEIIMTVPDKYVTLSNGALVNQKKNSDGTRSDHWEMELPHSPYLFFMGVGDYAVIKDYYHGKEVSYYVEKEYAPVARKIFGLTPEMIAFFERITGIPYPWAKYAQMTARDYVSGAMENTTATLHDASAQQDARELVDENRWESTVAHELFHQWFGDYVTAESWSNLTVNESFADYSQYLWKEYKWGSDVAAAENYTSMSQYFSVPQESQKDLVRFFYREREDMFDAVSYQKGGRILHMLRQHVGDSVFFIGLNKYLTTNKFSSGEAHQLRLALEEVSGMDLNWFFNQWYFGSGHPKVNIQYTFDEPARKVSVTIKQLQGGSNLFRIPLSIDIYNGATKVRHPVWIEKSTEVFTFGYVNKPDLINVDGDKFTLWQKSDNRPLETFMHQYTYAGNYVDRLEAAAASLKQLDHPKAIEFLKVTLHDKSPLLRKSILERLDLSNEKLKDALESDLASLAKNDPAALVRAKAIELLGVYKKPEYVTLFNNNLNDSSYSVAGAALESLSKIEPVAALTEAKRQKTRIVKGGLAKSVSNLLVETGSEEYYDYIAIRFDELPWWFQIDEAETFGAYLGKLGTTDKIKKGIDMLVRMRDEIPQEYKEMSDPMVKDILNGIADKKKAGKQKELVSYIQQKLISE